jgi:NitT/TauT family transport system substrate-binding protein
MLKITLPTNHRADTMLRLRDSFLAALVVAATGGLTVHAQAMDKVKVATTFLGLWDTSQPTFCKDRGEFSKAGLDVDVISTRGGSENVQAVTAGGMDIGYSPGTNSVLAAYMQGAKIKIISTEFIGQNDTYFYVRADSPLKTIDDIKGKSVAYPRPGGASEGVLLGLKAERHIDFNAVATGAMDATFTMVMTKQIDVGYSILPNQLDSVAKGDIRVLFSGDDVKSQRDISGRVIIASADFVKNHRATLSKFLPVLDGCIDWVYAHEAESSKMYAALNKVDAPTAAKALAFYGRSALAFGPLTGWDEVVKQSLDAKFISAPPTSDQVKDLVDIIYTTGK